MRNKKQRVKTRTKRAAVRRRRRTYSYSVSGISARLRLGAGGIVWSRVLDLALLLAMVALLIWFSVDLRFFIYGAEVRGHKMISAEEIYRASDLNTMSVFFVNRARVAERIRQQVPGIAQVRVECQWPNRVSIHIREYEVRFVWYTDGTAFLVDSSGRVLKVDDGVHEELLTICDLDNQPLEPGDQVDQTALNAVSGLHKLLPEVKVFEYSRAKGVSLLDTQGWRIYFGDDQSLTEKVANMRAILQVIANDDAPVEVIDLRFVDSPYYR